MKIKKTIAFYLLMMMCLYSCRPNAEQTHHLEETKRVTLQEDTIIIDSQLTFEEAIAGTNAPQLIIDQLVLFDVQYYSFDNKLHQGQLLTNKKIEKELKEIFQFIVEQRFPIDKVIPIVAFNWNDTLSMEANNSYSFCYRNTDYSKHAIGMAIDINPRNNPLRWKSPNSHRTFEPANGTYNPDTTGTFYENHPVVNKFKKLGFRWGHYFSKYYDDHHFEKK